MLKPFPSIERGSQTATNPLLFSPYELRRVLGCYSLGVMAKNWRDYGIEATKTQTVFCVIEHGQGVIASISKNHSQQKGGKAFWRVFDGNRQICQSAEFDVALAAFKGVGVG